MTTTELQRNELASLLVAATDKLDRLTEQRDELLAALRGLLSLESRYTNVGLKEFDAARAIIAKCEAQP